MTNEKEDNEPKRTDPAGALPGPDKSFKESLYDRIRMPIWVLDVVIAACVIAIAYLLIAGSR